MHQKRINVLLWAYACSPNKGSEPGAGWHTACALANNCSVWVITDARNNFEISRYLESKSDRNLKFIFIGNNFSNSIWNKIETWSLIMHYVFYLLWQIRAFSYSLTLIKTYKFEFVHHLTYANYWFPTLASFLPLPFVWTSGGSEKYPISFLETLSYREYIREVIRNIVLEFAHILPWTKYAAKRAKIIISPSLEVRQRYSTKSFLLSTAALSQTEFCSIQRNYPKAERKLRIISVGRLIGNKGYSLSIKAFHQFLLNFPNSEYLIVGDGLDRVRLQKEAAKIGLHDQVKFIGWISRSEVFPLLAQADIFVHPALHELAGAVLIEAMAAGLPVICLSHSGPAILVPNNAGIKINPQNPQFAIQEMCRAMEILASSASLRSAMGQVARTYVEKNFIWEKIADKIMQLYISELQK